MQTTTSRLHPLLTIAAISITVLAAVGVASLTGMISVSKGQENALQLPSEVIKPIEPAISHPVTKPAAKKIVARDATPRPVEPAVYREFSEAPRVTETPVVTQAPPVVEAPKPQVLPGQFAVVESVREVKEPGDAKGVGAVAGGVVGGVLGNKLGKGKGLVTILGAAGGAFAGHQIEKQARAEKRWEIAVRLDDGSQRTLSSEVEPAWRAGDRVRLVDDKLQPV
ncbi:MAG TPA: glycine zipper 2TM domain-containing protein [Burkholderiales bacterium]|nr:glycine zipper 2TM domain-containing protein [Burkholderiales bacterium]